MEKLLALFVLLSAVCLQAGENPQVRSAPLNPDFIGWMRSQNRLAAEPSQNDVKTVASSMTVMSSAVRSASPLPGVVGGSVGGVRRTFGYVPSQIDFSHLKTLRKAKVANGTGLAQESLPPAKYDLRTDGVGLPAIRDQGSYGTCWAHAVLGSIESRLINLGEGKIDFSEKHLANLHGRDNGFSEGGNAEFGIGYLARLAGPIAESEDPYPDSSYYIKWAREYGENSRYIRELKVSKSPVGTPLRYALNAEQLSPMTDGFDKEALTAIKRAVMDYGALYVSYTHVWGALDNNNITFYWNGSESVYDSRGGGGHAVQIVGWDDDYKATNFKYTPPGDGAFIVKNSWGNMNSIGGYNYVSYHDAKFAKGEIFSFQTVVTTDAYTGVYEHDPIGRVTSLGLGSDTAYGANMFTAKRKETLSAVGVYANAQNTEYAIDVYTGCTAGKPTSGMKVSSVSGTLACGYFTIPLSAPVAVQSGERFSVIVRLKTPGYTYPLAVESATGYYDYCFDPTGKCYDYWGYGDGFDVYVDDDGFLYAHFFDDDSFCKLIGDYWYFTEYTWDDMTEHFLGKTMQATANAGESYYSSSGSSWTDLTTYDSTANFCCKVYATEPLPDPEPVKEDKPTSFAAALAQDGNSVNLTWTPDSKSLVFRIYRSTTPTRPSTAYRTVMGDAGYVDATVVNGKTYYYWLTAQDPSTDRLESDPVGPCEVSVPASGPAAKPDLAVSSFFVTTAYGGKTGEETFYEGDTIYVNLDGRNSGDASVVDSFIVKLRLYDQLGNLLGEREIPHSGTLAAGATATWHNINWGAMKALSSGKYRLNVELDVDQAVDESDRANNASELEFDVLSRITLPVALDNPLLQVTTGGSSDWYGCLRADAIEGGSVARSGMLAAGQSNWMRTEFAGSGVVSFHGAFVGDGAFICRVDGLDYSITSPWSSYSFEMAEDMTHVVEWVFTAASQESFAMVDSLSWSCQPLPEKPELSVRLLGGGPQYVSLTYGISGMTQVDSYFYRAETENGAKSDFNRVLEGSDEVRDVSAEEGKVYWYWVCASNRYGTVWSDPVRAGWGLASLSATQAVEVPVDGCETNFAGETSWTASADQPWITIPHASSHKGEPIAVKIEPNSDGKIREGVLTVVLYRDGATETVREYVVRQLWNTTDGDFVIEDGVLVGYKGNGGDVVIPETVTNINAKVFSTNSVRDKITSVVIPGSVRTVGMYAFSNCSKLRRVVLGEGVEEVGKDAFSYCKLLEGVALPTSLKSMGNYVFASCPKLSAVELCASISSIPSHAFDGCSSLSSVVTPDGVCEIKGSAFNACSSLKDVEISESVTNIENHAFSYCTALTNVTYLGDAPKVGNDIYFNAATDLVSHVSAISTGWDGQKGSLDLPSAFPVKGGGSARAIERAHEWDTFPEPPATLTCTGDPEGVGVALEWTAGPRAMSYRVYRSTDEVRPAEPLAEGIEGCGYIDETALAGVDYFYWVSSVNNAGEAVSAPESGHRIVAATLSAMSVAFDDNGGEFKLVVNANADWTAVTDSSWFEMDYVQNGGNGTVTLVAPENGTQSEFKGQVTIEVGMATRYGVTYQVPVLQTAMSTDTTAVPVIVPGDGATFQDETCMVTITCATADAEIYFTTDGKTPRPTPTFRYGGPFAIYDTVEICAFAVKSGCRKSDFAEATISKVVPTAATLAGAIDLPGEMITTDGDELWFGAVDASASGGYSGRSGKIAANQLSRMRWTVTGSGTLTFKWRSDCEQDPRDRYSYDCGVFTVDGEATGHINGTTVWQTVTVPIEGGGTHVLEWSYRKDDYDEEDFRGEDCVWVDAVKWVPDDVTVDIGGKTIIIPRAWFDQYAPDILSRTGTSSYRDAAVCQSPGSEGLGGKTAADGSKWLVWMDYVCDTNPLDSDSQFRATITMVDGVPKVEWTPNASLRSYLIFGKHDLKDEDWTPVAKGHEAEFNFFKVSVEMQ